MTAEGRTQRAIDITRDTLKNLLYHPVALAVMAGNDVTPEIIEETITEILEYLAKTSPEANKEERVQSLSITKTQLKHELDRLYTSGWITKVQFEKVLTTLGYTKKEAEG